MNYIVLNKQQF